MFIGLFIGVSFRSYLVDKLDILDSIYAINIVLINFKVYSQCKSVSSFLVLLSIEYYSELCCRN